MTYKVLETVAATKDLDLCMSFVEIIVSLNSGIYIPIMIQ